MLRQSLKSEGQNIKTKKEETKRVEKNMTYKVGVIVYARNEENSISECLRSCYDQIGCDVVVSLCDDNSNDRTKEIAQRWCHNVVTFPYEHENWVNSPNLAKVANTALQYFKDKHLDYIVSVGADTVLPYDYFFSLIKLMLDNNQIMASGEARNEINVAIRGSGRVINFAWWKSHGLFYPVVYGWESIQVYQAMYEGWGVGYYPEKKFIQTRDSKTNYNPNHWLIYGKAMKVIGYSPVFVLAKCASVRNFKIASDILSGYTSGESEYDAKLAKYVRQTQNKNLINPKYYLKHLRKSL